MGWEKEDTKMNLLFDALWFGLCVAALLFALRTGTWLIRHWAKDAPTVRHRIPGRCAACFVPIQEGDRCVATPEELFCSQRCEMGDTR